MNDQPVALQRLHPASVLFHWFAVVRSGAVPLVLVLLQTRSRGGEWIMYGVGGLLLAYVLGSVLRYVTTRYGLGDGAMHFRSGVIARQSRVIPYGRIQSVDVRQSAVQRLLRMGELRVETATRGASAEVTLRVLRWPEAQALREHLVRERRSALAESAPLARTIETEGDAASATPVEAEAALAATPIAALDVEQLMIAGGTSNNVGVLLALLFSACERVRSSFFDDLDFTNGIIGSVGSLTSAVGGTWAIALVVLLVVLPLLVASWLVSVSGSVVRYYGFTLERVGHDLRRRHGLLSRVEVSVPVRRAQALRFHQSVLRRPFDLGELHLISAGASRGNEGGTASGRQVLLPILRRVEVSRFVPEVFPDAVLTNLLDAPVSDSRWRRPAPAAALRIALDSSWRAGLLIGVVTWWRPDWLASVLWLLPVLWGLAVIRRRARGLAVADGHVLVREGGLARTTMILPERKLQLVEVRQGPLQRLCGLATLRFTTAGTGGDADMHDLPLADARSVQEDLISRLPRAVRRTPMAPPRPAVSVLHAFHSEVLPHAT